MVSGDFNRHVGTVGFLGGQALANNGRFIIEIMEDFGLTCLNADAECQRLYTWEARNQNSLIDYALVNSNMYNCTCIIKT